MRTNNLSGLNTPRTPKGQNNTDNASDRGSRVVTLSRSENGGSHENFEDQFKKQTHLESHVTMLTIKRTMTCFFAIIFSVPFFISTTYKSYLTEFDPISSMIVDVKQNENDTKYHMVLDYIVQSHKDDFDKLIGLEAPGYVYKSSEYENDEIRALNMISYTANSIKFTVDLTPTMKLYAICGI